MKYLDFFDDVYYINLDFREDRKISFERKSAEVGIEANRFSAFHISHEECQAFPYGRDKKRRFKISCSLSHIAVVKEAKERNLNNVLIFEDDCVFHENFKEEISKCVEDLKGMAWDVIYFGGCPHDHCTPVTENIYNVNLGGVWATHAYAVNHTFFDEYSAINAHTIDCIDQALVFYNKYGKNFLLSTKLLALQEELYSDIDEYVKSSSLGMETEWSKYVTNSKFN